MLTSETHALRACRFSVTRFAAWAPEGDAADTVPKLEQMPAMLRRHAGRLGRVACEVAYRALDGATGVPVVFASRYGEASRSVDLLEAMVGGQPLSPTSFSLSVHNAVGGLFSMARSDTGSCVSLAAGVESAETAVLEACALMDDGAAQVLIVVADCPLPPVYESFAAPGDRLHGFAALLAPASGTSGASVSLIQRSRRADEAATTTESDMPAYRVLSGESTELVHVSARHAWEWRRDV